MSKLNRSAGLRTLVSLVATGAWAFLHSGCGTKSPEPEASTFSAQKAIVPDGACQFILAGVVPDIPGAEQAAANGFLDEATWDAATQRLRLRGWAAFDTGSPTATLIVRDPFGLLTFATPPQLKSYQRPDVAAKHPNRPDMLDSGFEMSIATVTGAPGPAGWVPSIEVYGVNSTRALTRLQRTGGKTAISWDRQPDRFALSVIHSAPDFEKVGKRTGNLDSLEAGPTAGTVRLRGWADFDGSASTSTMVLELPASLAPVSIVSHGWMPRPDVRELIDPSRPELARSGFDIVLSINGSADLLRAPGALRMWSTHAGGTPIPVSPGVLRR